MTVDPEPQPDVVEDKWFMDLIQLNTSCLLLKQRRR